MFEFFGVVVLFHSIKFECTRHIPNRKTSIVSGVHSTHARQHDVCEIRIRFHVRIEHYYRVDTHKPTRYAFNDVELQTAQSMCER